MTRYVNHEIAYGSDREQFAHLYKPEQHNIKQKKLPVVIVIHGGYWKDNHNLDSYATSAIVDYLQELNVAIWNLEYRRMNALGNNSKAKWPAPFQDVADGIDYLRKIDEIEHLDLTRILLVGHSAGGHLATWAASRSMIPHTSRLHTKKPLSIQRVISVAGILNLFNKEDVDQPEQIERLMGGSAKDYPERYRASDPVSLYHDDLKITVVHGEQDNCVKVNQAHTYCNKASKNINQVILPSADHFSMLPHDGDWQVSQWHQLKELISSELAEL